MANNKKSNEPIEEFPFFTYGNLAMSKQQFQSYIPQVGDVYVTHQNQIILFKPNSTPCCMDRTKFVEIDEIDFNWREFIAGTDIILMHKNHTTNTSDVVVNILNGKWKKISENQFFAAKQELMKTYLKIQELVR